MGNERGEKKRKNNCSTIRREEPRERSTEAEDRGDLTAQDAGTAGGKVGGVAPASRGADAVL